ncbi:MAG: response regulator transcription factor [Burkholderiaceae bacterium]|nr:response regulator transcription factor [Burkholderiaceae bacterium]
MKVLLVDDHPLILSALEAIIQTLDDHIEVLSADNPDDAFALLARDGGVELVLLDLSLGEKVDGFAVLADLRLRHPALPVVVISATEKLSDMVRAVDMGAMGFVPKRSSNRELFEALSLVLAGGVFIPPALLSLVRLPGMKLADAAAAADAAAGRIPAPTSGTTPASAGDTAPAVMRPMPGEAGQAPATGSPLAVGGLRVGMASLGLTPRQTDVLALLLKGLPNKLIARELNVSVDTVKDHVAAVLRTLGVNSRTQAVLVVSRMTQQGAAARQP